MKMLRPLLLVAALALGACQTVNPFASVTNPVTSVDMYRVKNTYAATLQLAANWRTFCYARTYKSLMADPVAKPVCQNRRSTVRQIKKYQPLAGTAISKADAFVAANPTVSAANLIGPAWDAVTAFQAVVPRVN